MIKRFIHDIIWRFGAFYYSAKQNATYDYGDEVYDTYFRPLFGFKDKLYSEWASKYPYKPFGEWGDYKFLGYGFYKRSIPRMAKHWNCRCWVTK